MAKEHMLRVIAGIGLSVLVHTAAVAQEAASGGDTSQRPLLVRTMVVGTPSESQERQFFGRIAALETADLSFEVPGRLVSLATRRGAFVSAGVTLATLEVASFERAVATAELNLRQAERDLERLQTLAARNVSSETAAEDAETARNLAEIAFHDARDALADASLTAPFDGIVADRLVATYTNVTPGQPVLRLHNMSETRVEFDLPERLLTVIGDPASVVFETVLPGQEAPATLAFREIEAETGAIGQSYTISLAVIGDVPANVLPGKTVTVTARLPEQTEAVTVPATAVVTRPDGETAVVALAPEGDVFRPAFLPVDVVSTTGVDLMVAGLPAGTEIVELGGHLVGPDTVLARYEGLIAEGN